MKTHYCRDCKYYEPFTNVAGSGRGKCRCNPPILQRGTGGVWPIVEGDTDWCGNCVK